MASLTDPETRATAISVRLTVNRLGQLTLPAVVGLFASIGGVAGVLWLASGIMAASAAPLARLRDATARSQRPRRARCGGRRPRQAPDSSGSREAD